MEVGKIQVELSPKAAKYLSKLDTVTKNRIVKGLKKLALEPPQGDIKNLNGKDGFRLRIGKYRILFDIVDNAMLVYEIDSRGQIYKQRG